MRETDCVELLVEHFMPLTPAREEELLELRESLSVVLHGVSLSIGSIHEPPVAYWDALNRIAELTGAEFLGEHLSVSRSARHDLWHLSPIWRSAQSLEACRRNVEAFHRRTGMTLALENITELVTYGAQTFSPAEFAVAVCDDMPATLLLDITNLRINVANGIPGHSAADLDSYKRIPWTQFHLAGGLVAEDGFVIDSHSEPLVADDLELLAAALERQLPTYVIVERDENVDDVASVLDDVRAVRSCVAAAMGQ